MSDAHLVSHHRLALAEAVAYAVIEGVPLVACASTSTLLVQAKPSYAVRYALGPLLEIESESSSPAPVESLALASLSASGRTV